MPLSRWRGQFADAINKVEIAANEQNGLDADSAADFLQVRSVALERFIDRLGNVGTDLVDEIVSGVAIAIGGGSDPD